jgi:hypothetical protein
MFDDAGQFHIPNHALHYAHAERLLQELTGRNGLQAWERPELEIGPFLEILVLASGRRTMGQDAMAEQDLPLPEPHEHIPSARDRRSPR